MLSLVNCPRYTTGTSLVLNVLPFVYQPQYTASKTGMELALQACHNAIRGVITRRRPIRNAGAEGGPVCFVGAERTEHACGFAAVFGGAGIAGVEAAELVGSRGSVVPR